MVYHALEWDCEMDGLLKPLADISECVRKECTDERGVLYGTEDLKWYTWSVVDGSWFAKVNLNLPELCGFFPRQSVCNHLSNPDENDLDISEMLSIEGYQELDVEAKKAYQYFEYTEPYGNRSILRDFKQNVMERVHAYNWYNFWEDHEQKISINDIRVLILLR